MRKRNINTITISITSLAACLKMSKILFAILLGFSSFIYAQDKLKFTYLNGDYLGQIPPGDSAVIFAPGIISLTGRSEMKIAFSPDGKECYYITSKGLYYRKLVNNLWTEPVIVSFNPNVNLKADDVNFSADGNRLYFNCFNADATIWEEAITIKITATNTDVVSNSCIVRISVKQ